MAVAWWNVVELLLHDLILEGCSWETWKSFCPFLCPSKEWCWNDMINHWIRTPSRLYLWLRWLFGHRAKNSIKEKHSIRQEYINMQQDTIIPWALTYLYIDWDSSAQSIPWTNICYIVLQYFVNKPKTLTYLKWKLAKSLFF